MSAPNPTRRILIVSYWYPPAVGAAAERAFGFARHLPAHGWEAHVLTASRPSAAPETPGVTVHNVDDPLAVDQPFADFDPRETPSVWKSMARQLIFPDRFVRWRKAAESTLKQLTSSTPFDVILVTFPPASAVQTALADESGAKIVLDYRDRWIGPGGYEPSAALVRRRHEKLESAAVRRAARIVAVSDAMADAIAAEQRIDRSRVVVIPNGYEIIPLETQQAAAVSEEGNPPTNDLATRPLVIAHVGAVIPRNRPELFFDALARGKGDPRLRDFLFRFVGNLSRDYIASLGLAGLVQSTGLLPRDEAIHEMQSADALLLLTGEYVGRWGASAKLFEYLQTGLPVLCLEEKLGSNDRALLERFIPERSFFAPIGDGDRILEQVSRVRAYRSNRPSAALELDPTFRDFGRANLTATLAQELNMLLDL